MAEQANPKDFGNYLREVRQAVGLTLRQVEERTEGRVKNGYLSQIENGTIALVSPGILSELAATYGLPWRDLLVRGGHTVPQEDVSEQERALAGLPMRALAELTPEERNELVGYIQFMRKRKKK